MDFDFGRMNDEQKSAVLHGDGPCVVTAGAGSGKTTVLTKKIEYMLKVRKIAPKNILAITFTKKAATEMKERLIALVGEELGNGVFLGTFHSFGLRVIWYKANRDGREREKILNEFEQRQIDHIAKRRQPRSFRKPSERVNSQEERLASPVQHGCY